MKKTILLIMLFGVNILCVYSQTTRYWIGGGTAHFTDGTKWSLTSGGAPIGGIISWQNNDIAKFDANSGSPTVNYSSRTNVGKLQISGNITVTLRNTDSSSRSFRIRASASDAFTLASASTLVIAGASKNTTLRMYNTAGVTANISGTVKVTTGPGGGIGKFERGSSAVINFNEGSYYQHDVNSDALPEANWHVTSTCAITGITSSGPSKMDQSFGHLIWNCPGQTSDISINDSFTVKGNFTVLSTASYHLRLSTGIARVMTVAGNYIQSAGTFIISSSGANSTMNVNGNFTINGGDFYISQGGGLNHLNIDGNFMLNNNRTLWMSSGSGYTNLNVKGHFAMSGDIRQNVNQPGRANIVFNGTSTQIFTRYSGIFYYGINYTVKSTSTFDMGTSVLGHISYSSGTFTLESGATLRTAHQQGITQSGASGCVQVTGTRTFPSGANYNFYRNGAQESGNGLPATLNGVFTIGSLGTSTHLTLPAGVRTINNKLVLVSSSTGNSSIASGAIAYGANGALEYQGASAQTTANAEFPSANGPRTLIINNTHGVLLQDSRTILTALNLQQGQLSIGSNTLTLNGALNQTSGSWAGGLSSNLVMGGTGASTNLPAITLNSLTINRSAGIGLAGNINIQGTAFITNGNLAANGYSLHYEPGAVLRYNGSTPQTTGDAELPAENAPSEIIVENNAGVTLHASINIDGILTLASGSFALGNNTLTISGIINQLAGNLTGGITSNIVFEENENPACLPAIILNHLTVNRSAGICMNGTVTVHGTLNLVNGNFSIGSNMLSMNGTINYINGTLEGGVTSSIMVGGSGPAVNLPAITLQMLNINRMQGAAITGDLVIKQQLGLLSGPLIIGANTVYLDGDIVAEGGSLQGSMLSNLVINPNIWAFLPMILPSVELQTLTLNRLSGAVLQGTLTIYDELILESGELLIGAGILQINGQITESGGQLVSTENSGLFVGGNTDALEIFLDKLLMLQISRPAGMILGADLDIYGWLNMIQGNIIVNGHTLSYQPGATLRYSGHSPQITTDAEFPSINGPKNLDIVNVFGVELHDSRTIEGNFHIFTGHFAIGTNTLILNGEFFAGAMGFGGGLTGGEQSNLIIGGAAGIVFLNNIALHNFIINRPEGVIMQGDLDLYGTLTLEDGALQIADNQLTLRNPVAGDPEKLELEPMSSVEISGSAEGIHIGPEENLRTDHINRLIISNTSQDGVRLHGNLDVFNELRIRKGSLFTVFSNHELTVHEHPIEEINISGNLILEPDAMLSAFQNMDILNGGQLFADAGAVLIMGAGKTLSVNEGGRIGLHGNSGSQAMVSSHGYFSFDVNGGGSIEATYATFARMDINGLHIHDRALVDTFEPFYHCVFQDGSPGAAFITANNDQYLVINAAAFIATEGIEMYNVVKNNDAGRLTFANYHGNFGGEDYEHDPFHRVDWYEFFVTDIEIESITITTGEEVCFDALHNIVVAAGDNTFVVENGGFAELIAGRSILMMTGVLVEHGGRLHAWISNDATFCAIDTKIMEAYFYEPLPNVPYPAIENKPQFFRIYPNPASHQITVELLRRYVDVAVYVDILDFAGDVILTKVVIGSNMCVFDLNHLPPGLYFVRVLFDNSVGIAKVIKL